MEQKSETEIKPNQTDTCIIIKRVWICVILLGIYFILFYYFFNLKKSRRIRCYLKKKEAKRCRFMLGFLIFYPSINSFYSFIRPLTLSLSLSPLISAGLCSLPFKSHQQMPHHLPIKRLPPVTLPNPWQTTGNPLGLKAFSLVPN